MNPYIFRLFRTFLYVVVWFKSTFVIPPKRCKPDINFIYTTGLNVIGYLRKGFTRVVYIVNYKYTFIRWFRKAIFPFWKIPKRCFDWFKWFCIQCEIITPGIKPPLESLTITSGSNLSNVIFLHRVFTSLRISSHLYHYLFIIPFQHQTLDY